jgi:hypothetical protein
LIAAAAHLRTTDLRASSTILPNWTVKCEFLYKDFGVHLAEWNFGTWRSMNLDGDFFDHRNRLYTAKLGLNYRWVGTALR